MDAKVLWHSLGKGKIFSSSGAPDAISLITIFDNFPVHSDMHQQ
jgi:hypothetical protein